MRALLGLTTALLLAGCGSDDPSTEGSETKAFTVDGTVEVDDLSTVRNTGPTCRAPGVGDRSVVVSGPDGTELGLDDLGGTGQSVTTKNGKFYVPGVCEFRFTVSDVPVADGVFTVEVEGVVASDRVTVDDPSARLVVDN